MSACYIACHFTGSVSHLGHLGRQLLGSAQVLFEADGKMSARLECSSAICSYLYYATLLLTVMLSWLA